MESRKIYEHSAVTGALSPPEVFTHFHPFTSAADLSRLPASKLLVRLNPSRTEKFIYVVVTNYIFGTWLD